MLNTKQGPLLRLASAVTSVDHWQQGLTCMDLTFKSECHRVTYEARIYGNRAYSELDKLNEWFTLAELDQKFNTK